MEDRVPVFEICRYFAFAAFLDHGRPSVGLAPTIVWDCILASASVFTVALPATKQMLKGKVKSVEGGKHWQSNATRDRQQSRPDLEGQVPVQPPIDLLSRTVEDMPPSVSRSRPSSSLSQLGLDEVYGLDGAPPYASSESILKT